MRIKVAAAAPELLPGQPGQNMASVLAAISRAREDGASILVLPADLPEDMNRGALERQAGKMTVYPIMKPSLSRADLLERHDDLDVWCCSADTPTTVSSHYDNINLAGLVSHENMTVVVMACPQGGDGSGKLYTGQCLIAQNGAILQSADGYVLARVTIPGRGTQPPVEGLVSDQPTTPWTPFPEMLPRVIKLAADGLARRMMALGVTQLTVSIGRNASSLLALTACVAAVDRLKMSHKNIHVTADGNRAGQIAAAFGVTLGGEGGLAVDWTDLTARALDGTVPEHYAVNATVPRSVARLAMRWYANTCGNMALSVPIRSIVHDDDSQPWELYDFLLHYSLVYDLSKWSQARMLEDTFEGRFPHKTILAVLDRFFDQYHRPAPCEGPDVFSLDVIREAER